MKMNRFWIGSVAVVGLVLAIGRMASAANGGATSGGGFRIYPHGSSQAILFDFVEINPEFQDQPGVSITLSRVGDRLGYEVVDLKNHPAFELAQSRIRLWEKSSPIAMGMVRDALDAVTWRFGKFSVPQSGETFVIPGDISEEYVSSSKIRPTIQYTELFGAMVSTPHWNELGLASQAGLILHEGFRHVQIAYQTALSTGKIQKIVAAMMLRSPSEVQSLDTLEYLDGRLAEMAEERAQVRTYALEFVERLCVLSAKADALSNAKSSVCTSHFEFDEMSIAEIKAALENLETVFDSAGLNELRNEAHALKIESYDVEIARGGLANAFRMHQYMDATRGLSNLYFGVGEKVIMDYLNGTESFGLIEGFRIRGAIAKIHQVLKTTGSEQ